VTLEAELTSLINRLDGPYDYFGNAAALDIATYAKTIGIVSGTQGTPSLQQIQDVFGAAKQNYQP